MLRVTGISKIFGKGTINEKIALRNIDLNIDEGEFVTVIGGNGAGKSTLLNCISGAFEIDSGSIYIDSKNVSYLPEYKRSRLIGRVFQDPLRGTAHEMTIEENMAMAFSKGKLIGLQRGINKRDINKFREKLALLDMELENRMKHKVGLLSGGQRQALTLLMATLVNPKLLLLDEHTAALDPVAAQKVLSLTKSIVLEQKISTIMITHNMSSALEYGNRTIMMNEGEIILDVKDKEREALSVEDLINQFGVKSGKKLDSDRMLL